MTNIQYQTSALVACGTLTVWTTADPDCADVTVLVTTVRVTTVLEDPPDCTTCRVVDVLVVAFGGGEGSSSDSSSDSSSSSSSSSESPGGAEVGSGGGAGSVAAGACFAGEPVFSAFLENTHHSIPIRFREDWSINQSIKFV